MPECLFARVEFGWTYYIKVTVTPLAGLVAVLAGAATVPRYAGGYTYGAAYVVESPPAEAASCTATTTQLPSVPANICADSLTALRFCGSGSIIHETVGCRRHLSIQSGRQFTLVRPTK